MPLRFLLDNFRDRFGSRRHRLARPGLFVCLAIVTRRALAAGIGGLECSGGAVVAIEADFSPNAVALFLALIERGTILVPLTSSLAAQRGELLDTAEVEWIIHVDAQDQATATERNVTARHEFYTRLRDAGHPGLVLFSSGSTGKSKAAVHDLLGILEKFHVPAPSAAH